jgi:hypothetical protein
VKNHGGATIHITDALQGGMQYYSVAFRQPETLKALG